jgi:hypothetical protein
VSAQEVRVVVDEMALGPGERRLGPWQIVSFSFRKHTATRGQAAMLAGAKPICRDAAHPSWALLDRRSRFYCPPARAPKVIEATARFSRPGGQVAAC